MSANSDLYKQQAAACAVPLVQPGMVIGLGTGSTALHFLRMLAARYASGELPGLLGVPTSQGVADEAQRLGIPLTTLETHPRLALTVDGADEIDPQCNLIKGGGRALLREKIVAQASEREIIVADAAKRVPALGTTWALPVEVLPFGWRTAALYIESLGGVPALRMDGDSPVMTDNGNYLLDCQFGVIGDPPALAERLKRHAGIIEHGLFIGLAAEVITVGPDGVEHSRCTR